MDEYFIGAGAVLTAGPAASITGATLHAQPDFGLAGQVEAALIDFEAAQLGQVSRVLITAAKWTGPRFHAEVVRNLLRQAECSLAEVVATLADSTGASEVHLFAHWVPDGALTAAVARRGVRIVAHPLEALGPAALVSGQRLERWPAAARAA
ncbi:MAG TPA: hypothetical protein VFE16_10420 [Candidatus Cybelea sp.]|jgi:hypothetical protein|nr:hypothetical protein [Candidatus Cybelea sp.]